MSIDARHAPIRKLVRQIRNDTGAAVPDVDPDGGGIDATVLVVLRDPGRLGALTSNYLSVLKNPDRTAANQRRLFSAANLPVEACLFWNAVPWDLGGRTPHASDLEAGARYLTKLISLMPHPPVVVACGNEAHEACARAGVEAIDICHPSERGLHGGGVNREPAHIAGLREAARRARAYEQPARRTQAREPSVRPVKAPEERTRLAGIRRREGDTGGARKQDDRQPEATGRQRRAMGTEIRDLSKRSYDTHHVLTPEEQREALAHTLARELTAGATWDGIGGLKERGLVRSAPEGRTLLREYGLDWASPRGPGG